MGQVYDRGMTPHADPAWLVLARADLGTSEIPGPEDNPEIVRWHSFTTLRAKDDETPYCSAAVCAWFEEAGIKSTKSAAARSWEKWGQPVWPGAHPIPLGAVLVFWRGRTPSAPQGHVGLYMGGDPAKGRVSVLGANQSNTTSIISTPSARLIGARWPADVVVPHMDSWLPLVGPEGPPHWR